MDIEKLIEQLRWWADHCDRTNYGCHARTFLLDAATALTTLWDENERLRTKLQKSEHDNVNLTGEVAAELEQVKREREELEAALRREQDG